MQDTVTSAKNLVPSYRQFFNPDPAKNNEIRHEAWLAKNYDGCAESFETVAEAWRAFHLVVAERRQFESELLDCMLDSAAQQISMFLTTASAPAELVIH